MNENKNLIIVVLLSSIIMLSWQYFYEGPRLKKIAQLSYENKAAEVDVALPNINNETYLTNDRKKALEENKRITIKNQNIEGSISLKGAKLDDILLTNYFETIEENSDKVKLFSPSKFEQSYFAEFGWLSNNSSIIFPDKNTIWISDSKQLTPEKPIHLTWTNSQGLKFILKFELDKEFMIKISQSIENLTSQLIKFKLYGRLNRIYYENNTSFAILHEGAIGVLNDKLYEIRYKDLKKEQNNKKFFDIHANSWFGITDKYWLSSIIPHNFSVDTNFIYNESSDIPRYQVDFLSKQLEASPGETITFDSLLFIGPKKLELLDNYSKQYNIKLFDRAVDFGWFYFITKPMFSALQFLYNILGNFGISILVLTVLVKLLMFPLANKSYQSMNRMKTLQPRVTQLKELYGDDKLKLNQAIMDLYKREKINPLSGCLPILIQIPVFFSLYKVLFVTIEMRHTKFFGWIKDLSAPDPTSILNLFGLLPWSAPNFLNIGIWPIIMGLTMYFQQRLNPEPSDPLQAKLMKFLPLIFTFMFYTFPAGLIIYWAWNNILSILQQWFLMKNNNEKTI